MRLKIASHYCYLVFLFRQIISFSEQDNLLPAIRLRSSDAVFHVELATLLLDLDPSLIDRVHRTVDALNAAQQTSPIISRTITEVADVVMLDDGRSRVCRWLGEEGCDAVSWKFIK